MAELETINIIVMNTYDYRDYAREMNEMETFPKIGNNEFKVFQKINEEKLVVLFTGYCNRNEIILLDRYQFEILLGFDDKEHLMWNLLCLRPSCNRKIILLTGDESGDETAEKEQSTR